MRKSTHSPAAFALAQRQDGVSGAELAEASGLKRDIAGSVLRWMLASGRLLKRTGELGSHRYYADPAANCDAVELQIRQRHAQNRRAQVKKSNARTSGVFEATLSGSAIRTIEIIGAAAYR